MKLDKKKILKFCWHSGVIVGVWGTLATIFFVAYCSFDLPDLIPSLKPKDANIGVYYDNGVKLKTYGSYDTQITNYAEFPLHLVDALTATEDRKFFKHGGFDYFGITRAIFVNLFSGRIKQGGSTITQQLAKIILKNSKKTIKRKVQELLLAFQLEEKLTKEEILTLYLNKSYFGAGKWGIKSATDFYFEKKVAELNLEESAMLVGLLKAPTKYSPQNNPELSRQRTRQVLLNMEDAGFIDSDKYRATKTINKAVENSNYKADEYLYFSDWVRVQAKDYTDRTDIKIKTTLKQNMQNAIENTINEMKPEFQIAIVAINTEGKIIGMAGGNTYHKSEYNRAVYSDRQAGSAFKTFVYAAGFEYDESLSPDTYFVDEPVAVGSWFPENYNKKYYGTISLKESFAKSLNSVSVQVSEQVGVQKVAKMAKQMGITSKIDANDPTISLGTTQINPIELTSAYIPIINDGIPVIPYSIQQIKDATNGEVIYERKKSNLKKVLSHITTSYMRELLQEVVEDGTGKRAYIKGYDMGGKTGTSQNSNDAWFIGYIDDVVIGVWVGNDNNTSMGKMVGGNLPATIWKNVVLKWKKNGGD
ncbi:MAG: hypothetical protein Ta2D_04550 [Rickettsiales bacterium]|nr:MAG: hypothetical protein Ta2D_04550 [Rickettsiales bacterium]